MRRPRPLPHTSAVLLMLRIVLLILSRTHLGTSAHLDYVIIAETEWLSDLIACLCAVTIIWHSRVKKEVIKVAIHEIK